MRLFDVLPPPLPPKTEEIPKNPTNFINFQLTGLIILALFTCFCICANLITFILLILCRPLQRSSRTTNLYVISLCLADLGVGGVVMPLMLCYEWGINFPHWLCQFWQLADVLFCTESLYSICAIALDRVWNLEQPLRVFTSSRRRAKRLMLFVWLLPLIVWMPVYFLLVFPTQRIFQPEEQQLPPDFHCFPSRQVATQVFWVALPALYLPAIFLICLFLRISFVVHRHLKFLREHSSLPHLGPHPPPQQPSPQPLLSPTRNNFQYENDFNKNERNEINNNKIIGKRASVCATSKIISVDKNVLRKVSLPQWRKSSISVQRKNEGDKVKTTLTVIVDEGDTELNKEKQQKDSLCSIAPTFSISEEENEEDEDSSSNLFKQSSLLNKPLQQRRLSSARFSIITFSENIALILQREGVTQQVKAAKAVALILCCFLLCWFPFLIVWPLRLFLPHLISDRIFRLCLWLNYSCSTFNPLLYALSTPKIRSILRNNGLLPCKFISVEGGSGKNTRRSNTGALV
uniref:G-protein coupled receptors family 1 profile domain-containing protein n=1 Tax=Meloidogyne incognita TaxID=6306 RepID=A0A914MKZ3_MELIC